MNGSTVLIGGGAVAAGFHLPRLKALPGCTGVTIVEVDAARRGQLHREFARDRAVKIVDSLPADGRFMLGVIATPPKFHLEYLEKLNGRADGVVIEKPVAMNAAEARRVLEISGNGGPRVYVALIRRTLRGFELIRRMRASRQFGALRKVTIAEGGVFHWPAVSLGSFSRDLNGGGVLMDTGPHTIDLLFQVFDGVECRRSWMDADVLGTGEAIEANCTLELFADGSVPVWLSLSRNRYLSNSAVFEFDSARCSVGVRDDVVKVEMQEGTPMYATPDDEFVSLGKDFRGLFDRFYSRFPARGDNGGVSPEESEKVMRVIDAAYANAEPIRGGF
jgi:predicted dehydrogenase